MAELPTGIQKGPGLNSNWDAQMHEQPEYVMPAATMLRVALKAQN